MTPPLTLLLSQHAHSHLREVPLSQIIYKNRCGAELQLWVWFQGGEEVRKEREDNRWKKSGIPRTCSAVQSTANSTKYFLFHWLRSFVFDLIWTPFFYYLKSKWMLCFFFYFCLFVSFWNLIRFVTGSIQPLPVCVIGSGQIPIPNGSYFKVILKLISPCVCPNVSAGQRVHLSWLRFSSFDSNHPRQ